MRLNSLTLRDITRYEGEIRLDFEALGPGLIAIAGANGAGKTSLLEAPFGALYLEFPTRPGALYGVAHGKRAALDLAFSNGAPYRALVAVDAMAQKTEAYLYNGDGSPITDGKVRTYQAEIERRFGSSRLFLSACLSPQNHRGAFLELSKAERKDLLAEILDTGGLQTLAEAARERAKAAEAKLATLRGTIAAHEADLARMVAAAQDSEALENQMTQAKTEIATTEAELTAARERYTEAKTALALAQEGARARAGKVADLEAARRTASDLEGRLSALEAEKERGHERINETVKEARAEAARLPEYQAAAQRAAELAAVLDESRREETRLVAQIEEARTAYREAEDQHRQADRVANQIQAASTQASLLAEVPCGGEGKYAACRLIGAAKAAHDSIPEMTAQLHALRAELKDLAQLRAGGAELETRLRTIRDSIAKGSKDREAALSLSSRVALAKAADARLGDAERERLELDSSIAERTAQLKRDLASATSSLAKLQAEVAGLQSADLAALSSALARTEAEGRALKAQQDGQQRQLQDLAALIARAQEVLRRRAEISVLIDLARGQEADVVAEAAEWSTLERAFGRDGIQALEIDAAGPELSAVTNELLTSCFGERFEVRFVTQALRADGRGNKEVFDVQVIDHERGREGIVDSLSGGEKTIISEAISLALATYTGRHGGHRFETLFRDETAGQLDPDNAHRYVSMLRKARQIGGFHQVIYIAQQPEVWQAADAVLWCEGGKVEVRQ